MEILFWLAKTMNADPEDRPRQETVGCAKRLVSEAVSAIPEAEAFSEISPFQGDIMVTWRKDQKVVTLSVPGNISKPATLFIQQREGMKVTRQEYSEAHAPTMEKWLRWLFDLPPSLPALADAIFDKTPIVEPEVEPFNLP